MTQPVTQVLLIENSRADGADPSACLGAMNALVASQMELEKLSPWACWCWIRRRSA